MTKQSIGFTFKTELYFFWIFFSAGQTDAEVHKMLNAFQLNEKEIEEQVPLTKEYNGYCYKFEEEAIILVRMDHYPVTPSDYSDLNHEIFHIVAKICDYVGMELNNGSEEAYAYLISFISQKIFEKLW